MSTEFGLRDATGAEPERFPTVLDVMVTIPTRHPVDVTVAELTEFFSDEHVHAAVLVDPAGRLIAVVERADLGPGRPADLPAVGLGSLSGRVVGAAAELSEVWHLLRSNRRRRLAVVDDRGRLLGLVCLTRRGTGFCSDADVRARAEGAVRPD